MIFVDAEQTRRDREWYSIDIVRHRGRDGCEHYYSSKPPLLATLLAGPCWLLQQTTGATLADRPFYMVRLLLLLTNVLPLALYFLLLARLIERYGRTDWGRLYVLVAACFGTLLTTFAVTLNNHLIAAVSAAVAVSVALPIWQGEDRRWRSFALAGFFAAFTAANELPALSLTAVLAAALSWCSLRRTLLAFLPAAAVVAVAAFGTTYLAHGTWSPPYAHRGNGPLLTSVPGSFDTSSLDQGRIPDELRRQLAAAQFPLSPRATLTPRTAAAGWMLWDPQRQERLAVVARDGGLDVHVWDSWYEFPGSYWTGDARTGVDLGEPSRLVYAFQVLLGHHGVFSLTPVWLLSAAGLFWWLKRPDERMRGLAVVVAALTVVCLGFYILRPLKDRNYGGVCCGFRWLLWLAPLWLIAMLPAADRIAVSPRWRRVALALLVISIASASYASLNPWVQPWLYEYWSYLGWIE